MKTLIIYNDLENLVKFFVVDGDYSQFNNITFDGFYNDKKIECSKWLWTEDGVFKHEMSDDVSIVENKQWDKVAIITWLP